MNNLSRGLPVLGEAEVNAKLLTAKIKSTHDRYSKLQDYLNTPFTLQHPNVNIHANNDISFLIITKQDLAYFKKHEQTIKELFDKWRNAVHHYRASYSEAKPVVDEPEFVFIPEDSIATETKAEEKEVIVAEPKLTLAELIIKMINGMSEKEKDLIYLNLYRMNYRIDAVESRIKKDQY